MLHYSIITKSTLVTAGDGLVIDYPPSKEVKKHLDDFGESCGGAGEDEWRLTNQASLV